MESGKFSFEYLLNSNILHELSPSRLTFPAKRNFNGFLMSLDFVREEQLVSNYSSGFRKSTQLMSGIAAP